MKIIQEDNFCRDGVDDELIADHVDPAYVDSIVSDLNERFSGDNASYFFRSVPDDYKLKKFNH